MRLVRSNEASLIAVVHGRLGLKVQKKPTKKFSNIGETKDGFHLWLLSVGFQRFRLMAKVKVIILIRSTFYHRSGNADPFFQDAGEWRKGSVPGRSLRRRYNPVPG